MKFIFILLLIASGAHAGVSTVGKGGGYGEMLAIFVNEQMPLWANVCLKNLECGLSPAELSVLKKSTAGVFTLRADTDCKEPVILAEGRNSATLSSCVLYKKEVAVAKSFSEIATWVLAARLVANQNMPLPQAYNLALKVFKDYEQDEQRLSVVLSESTSLVHFLQIQRGESSYNIFSLEGKSVTFNLTQKLEEAFSCPAGQIPEWNLNLLGAQEVDPIKVFVESEVVWRCGTSEAYKATLELFYLAPQSEVSTDSVLMKVVRKALF